MYFIGDYVFIELPDNYPCPTCGERLIKMRSNIYYCLDCDKYFEKRRKQDAKPTSK